ncbi:MAG: DUF6488 family protein [Marinobacter sp.]|uniref:Peptidase propeptide and YPEB domain-containing protein n=1 Tax=Marinobacter antarcticus TaxID=564117 RepID=A0A831R3E8_9GAMM|nr:MULTISPECIES: DUF6488 family protein [Marinobacter]OHY82832.1 hypothetical protein BCA33_01110 [Marinobacter sp. AC-23]HEA53156.1 hypothetical protein [Marinobacter antarcticus]
MKNIILSFTVALVFSFAGQAFAGAGHSHGVSEPISKAQATQKAATVKQQLISSNQVSSAWSDIEGSSAQQRSSSAGSLWVVEYANPKATDENKSRLFVFVDEFGNPVGANHTGDL